MAVRQIDKYNFTCLSTDPKPTTNANVPLIEGTNIIELDTGNSFIYSSANICPTTNSGWWPL